jgi:hypothetical protein
LRIDDKHSKKETSSDACDVRPLDVIELPCADVESICQQRYKVPYHDIPCAQGSPIAKNEIVYFVRFQIRGVVDKHVEELRNETGDIIDVGVDVSLKH